MPFLNENKALGLPVSSPFQEGTSNQDDYGVFEKDASIPWVAAPASSYMYYECTVGVLLDSGIVVHHRLPQIDYEADTLSSVDLEDPNVDKHTLIGVNLKSLDQYEDIVQRMAHSRYWFRLWGQALRVGYKVPIPSIKKVGNVPVVPHDQNPQWAYNRIFPQCNFAGVPVWHAQWSLWYTIPKPPRKDDIPVLDLAAHISDEAKPPTGMQPPFSPVDDNATVTAPVTFGAKPTASR